MAKKAATEVFVFHKNDQIGLPAAEQDSEFLKSCFVDIGDLALIEDFAENRLIVLGRTGAGKSALFAKLKEKHGDRVIEVEPENLALTYVGHSTALNTFTSLGINLDPFFSLLWRHIFVVEILRRYFKQYAPPQSPSLWEWLLGFFTGKERENKAMTEAIEYLRSWGEEFWQETEYRVKEITQKMEVQLTEAVKGQLGNKFASVGVDMNEVQKLSAEEKTEVQNRGQEVVSRTQVKDLHQALKMLENILADRQKQYFIIVDRLDEHWVEDKLRYRLIMALIQTAKEFIKVKNAKIVIALRRDLIDRVFRRARDSGFQEEKFEALYLQLRWTKEEILDVLDRRVNHLVRRRYTKGTVSHRDLMPSSFHGMPIADYIYSLAPRPRDVIAFFNACIEEATNQPKLTAKKLSDAEASYSTGRLRALADEWSADYDHLIAFTRIFKGRPSSFKLETISKVEIENLCLNVITEHNEGKGELYSGARSVVDEIMTDGQFKVIMFSIFYRIGLVGLKTETHESFTWSADARASSARQGICEQTSIQVGFPYIRSLGVKDKVHSAE